MTRTHRLRWLQRQLDRTIELHGMTETRRHEIETLSLELQRELARLEQMPWPSGRAFVARADGRPLERRLVPLLRAVRSERVSPMR